MPDAAEAAAAVGTAFVTGGGGFAGRHLVDLLASGGQPPVAPASSELDLRDRSAVAAAIADCAPRAIFHLAAFSSPQRAWDSVEDSLLGNLEMTVNVLEAARHGAPAATVLLIGSGQVYGAPEQLPVAESAPLAPDNPYAASKAAGDMLGRQYAETYGMRVVRLRPFNHAGPGQSDEYVISSLARQVAEAEAAGGRDCVLATGNPESARDFTDVRDVVRAYALAARLDGGAFNVCSGSSASVAELVEMVVAMARTSVRHEIDPARLRAHDARRMRGSHEALTAATGWRPEIALEQTVADTLAWWRERLSTG